MGNSSKFPEHMLDRLDKSEEYQYLRACDTFCSHIEKCRVCNVEQGLCLEGTRLNAGCLKHEQYRYPE